jgi:hypothetical protein
MGLGMFLIGSCAASLGIWACSSYPYNTLEKVINRVAGAYAILSFLVLTILILWKNLNH